jgi:hypothetical protein
MRRDAAVVRDSCLVPVRRHLPAPPATERAAEWRVEQLNILFSAIVTLCTLGSALLTVLLLAETKRMREVQTEPKVDVTYRVREEWIAHLDIAVKNIGLAPAYDVRFRAEALTDDPDTHDLLRELNEIGFFRIGLNYLSAGQQAVSFFTNVSENHNGKLASRFSIAVSYSGESKRRYEDTYIIDLRELVGLRRIGEPPLYSMAKSLEAMQEDLHGWVGVEHAGTRARSGGAAGAGSGGGRRSS